MPLTPCEDAPAAPNRKLTRPLLQAFSVRRSTPYIRPSANRGGLIAIELVPESASRQLDGKRATRRFEVIGGVAASERVAIPYTSEVTK